MIEKITKNPPIFQEGDVVTLGEIGAREKEYVIDYEITTPKKISIDIDVDSGNTIVQNIEGKIKIDNKTGDVKLKEIKGFVEVNAGSGDITIKKVEGNTKVETSGRDIAISNKISKKS